MRGEQAWLAGVVPVEAVLARSTIAAIAIRGLVAHPEEFELTVAAWISPSHARRMVASGSQGVVDAFAVHPGGQVAPEHLHFAIELPDGTTVTDLDHRRAWRPDQPEARAGLMPRNGSGSTTWWEQTYRAWPVPTSGTLTFVCEWPAFAIAEARYELDAALVHAASERATPIWPDLSSG